MYINIHSHNIEVDKRIVSCCVPDKQINDFEDISFKTRVEKLNLLGEIDLERHGRTALSWRMMLTTGWV